MFAPERDLAAGRARRVAILVVPLLLLAACSSGSGSAKTKVASELATTSAALRGAGPGKECHPASAPAMHGAPMAVVPEVAPRTLQVTDLKVGHGDPVHVGQHITVQYLGVACSTGTQFVTTWDRNVPYGVAPGAATHGGVGPGHPRHAGRRAAAAGGPTPDGLRRGRLPQARAAG